MDNSIAYDKSKRFSIRIVRLCRYLDRMKHERILSTQLLRSGTSIGANLAEARYAISRNDFSAKVYVALKEAAETSYWLELLRDTDTLTQEEFSSIHADCKELIRMLSATTKTIERK